MARTIEEFLTPSNKEPNKKSPGYMSTEDFLNMSTKEYNEAVKKKTSEGSKQILNNTLKSVTKPLPIPKAEPVPFDFKATQSADLAKKKQSSPFEGKTLAPINTVQNNIQDTLKGKLPAAELLQQTGRGPANASKIPGVTEYGNRKKDIANSTINVPFSDKEINTPAPLKAWANTMNYLAYGNPLGLAVSNSFAGNSGATVRDTTGNKTVDKITDLVNDLVTPFITPTGAGVGGGPNLAPYKAANQFLDTKPGMTYTNYLADSLLKRGLVPKGSAATANRIAKNTIAETMAGPLQNVAAGLMNGQDSNQDIISNAQMGIAGGLGLGYGGSFLSELLTKSGIPEAEIAEILALPEGTPRTQRKTQAGAINDLGTSTDAIKNPYTFGLDEASPSTMGRSANAAEGRTALTEIDQSIRDLETKYGIAVIDEYKALKEQVNNPKGVQQGELYFDADGNVTGRRGRLSNNDRWYQEAMKENNYNKLSNKKLWEIAQKHVDEGFDTEVGRAPSWKQENAYDEQMAAFTSARETMQQSVREIDPVLNVTDSPLKEQVLMDTRKVIKPKTEIKPAAKSTLKPKAPVNAEVAVTLEAPIKAEVSVPAVKPEGTPKKKYKPGERGFNETLSRSDKTPEGFTDELSTKYEPTTNQGDLAKAEERIKDRAGATRYILEETKGGMTSEQSITAQRLMDTHLKEGNIKAAEEVADALLKESTRSAQFLQSLSAYNKLSPEGVYMVAKRYANKINETSSKLAKKAVVTPEMADDIQGLATINQAMTGVKDLSNDAVDILKRAKAGETLTDAETSVIQKFVDESRQFIKETGKKKPVKHVQPKLPKQKRVRDNVSSFLDAQEAAAKERLRKKGIRVSSTPLDIWADYAVIGAAKMGRGVIKFADWSEQMVKDLGEEIRPQLDNLYEKSREAFDIGTKKVTSREVANAERLTQKLINSKQLNEQEANSLLKLASQVDELSGEAKRIASQDLQVILQSLNQPSLLRKISSLQTQAQLLNPKTQVRNVLGNELFYRLERISKYISTPIDIAQSKLTGSDRTVTFRTHNQGKYWENFINGGNAGWRGVNINGIETQYDLSSPAFKGKYNPFTYTEKALGAALRSFDNAAYGRAVSKTLGELGTLDAINNGVKPTKEYVQEFIRKADQNTMKIANDYGKYVTAQDDNLISQGLSKFKRGLNFGKDFGIGDLIIKYPKTPGALLMRALEYSPAGFIRSAKIVADPLLRNGIDANPREAVEALGRAIVGTGGLSMLGYYLMDKEIITGAASGDKDIRSLQSKTGRGAYQVNLSALYRFVKSGFEDEEATIKEGDQLFNYDWMQPVSIAISLGANVKGNQDADSSKVASGALGLAYNSAAGALNTLTQQSVLQGVESALSGYTGQTSTDKIVNIIADMPSSFIPTFSNQNKQLQDNSKRETYAPTIGEKTLNTVKAKIPGLAQTLPKKYDTLGQEQTHYQDNNAFNVFANPGFPADYKLSDEARKIVDLISATGDEALAPRVPGKTINGVKLSGKEYSRFSQLQGEETKRLVSELDTSLSIEDQAEIMEKILREAGKTAKEKMIEEYPRLGE